MKVIIFHTAALAALFFGALANAQDYRLEHRSQFDGAKIVRNPFWPIGYVHEEEHVVSVAAPVRENLKITPDQFTVTTILSGGTLPLAVVNGKEVAVGDRLLVGNAEVEVAGIRDGEVKIAYKGQEISVPLRTR